MLKNDTAIIDTIPPHPHVAVGYNARPFRKPTGSLHHLTNQTLLNSTVIVTIQSTLLHALALTYQIYIGFVSKGLSSLPLSQQSH